jgi:RNA polymerase sigma-70 factor (ECF subfamily)
VTPRELFFEVSLEDLRVAAQEETCLIESYRPRLLYFALRRLRDRTLAEEIAQDTLTVVLQALRDNRIENPAKMPGFVFGVAKNLVSKALRKRSIEADAATDPEQVVAGSWLEDPDAALLLEEQRRQVRDALSELSPGDRDILQRIFVVEQSLEEIAVAIGIPGTAVRKRKSRALERLKKIFQERSQKR